MQPGSMNCATTRTSAASVVPFSSVRPTFPRSQRRQNVTARCINASNKPKSDGKSEGNQTLKQAAASAAAGAFLLGQVALGAPAIAAPTESGANPVAQVAGLGDGLKNIFKKDSATTTLPDDKKGEQSPVGIPSVGQVLDTVKSPNPAPGAGPVNDLARQEGGKSKGRTPLVNDVNPSYSKEQASASTPRLDKVKYVEAVRGSGHADVTADVADLVRDAINAVEDAVPDVGGAAKSLQKKASNVTSNVPDAGNLGNKAKGAAQRTLRRARASGGQGDADQEFKSAARGDSATGFITADRVFGGKRAGAPNLTDGPQQLARDAKGGIDNATKGAQRGLNRLGGKANNPLQQAKDKVDEATGGGRNILRQAADRASDAADNVTTGSSGNLLRDAGNAASGASRNVKNAANRARNNLSDTASADFTPGQTIDRVFGGKKTGLPDVGDVGKGAQKLVKNAGQQLDNSTSGIQRSLGNSSGPGGILGGAKDKLDDAASGAKSNLRKASNKASNLADDVSGRSTGNFLKNAGNSVTDAAKNLKTAANKSGTGLSGDELSSKGSSFLRTANKQASGAQKKVEEAASDAQGSLKRASNKGPGGLFNDAKNKVDDAASDAQGSIQRASNKGPGGLFQEAKQKVEEAASDVKDNIESITGSGPGNALRQAGDKASDLADSTQSAAKRGLNSVTDTAAADGPDVGGLFNKLGNKAEEAKDKASGAIRDTSNSIGGNQGVLSDAKDNIKGAARNASDSAGDAVSGLKDLFRRAGDSGSDIGRDAKRAAGDAADKASDAGSEAERLLKRTAGSAQDITSRSANVISDRADLGDSLQNAGERVFGGSGSTANDPNAPAPLEDVTTAQDPNARTAEVAGKIKSAFGGPGKAASDVTSNITAPVQGLAADAKDKITGAADSVRRTAANVTGDTADLGDAIKGAVIGERGSTPDELPLEDDKTAQDPNARTEELAGKIKSAFGGPGKAASDVTSNITAPVQGLAADAKDKISGAADSVRRTAANVTGDTADLGDVLSKATEGTFLDPNTPAPLEDNKTVQDPNARTSEVADKIKSALGGAPQKTASEIGDNVQGLASNVKGKVSDAADNVRRGAANVTGDTAEVMFDVAVLDANQDKGATPDARSISGALSPEKGSNTTPGDVKEAIPLGPSSIRSFPNLSETDPKPTPVNAPKMDKALDALENPDVGFNRRDVQQIPNKYQQVQAERPQLHN